MRTRSAAPATAGGEGLFYLALTVLLGAHKQPPAYGACVAQTRWLTTSLTGRDD
jgi:hypothetical protein